MKVYLLQKEIYTLCNCNEHCFEWFIVGCEVFKSFSEAVKAGEKFIKDRKGECCVEDIRYKVIECDI